MYIVTTLLGLLALAAGAMVVQHAPSDIQLGIAATCFGAGLILLVLGEVFRRLGRIDKALKSASRPEGVSLVRAYGTE